MIRRFAVAVVLLGCALLVLHATIGFENFAGEDLDRDGQPIRQREPDGTTGPGVVVGGIPGDDQAAISVSGRGRFEYARTEPYPAPNGETRHLPRYELVAQDSETLADDQLRLIDVEVRVHRIDEGPEPSAVHVGTITADEALVQVGRDERGNPSIREDRDMDLLGVRLVSTEHARIDGLLLEVDRLNVGQTENGIRFSTPREDMPFHVELGGEQPASLDGRGLAGFVPAEDAIDGRLELHVRSMPRFTRTDLAFSAIGPLDYVEDLRTSAGSIETSERVVVRGRGLGGGRGDTVARGDRLSATLVRDGDGGLRSSRNASWGRIVLLGSQASLVADQIELHCDVLSVGPSLEGRPAMFTAIGSPRVTDRRTRTTFHAEQRIHLVDLPTWIGDLHRAAGFGTPRLPEIASQLVVFEGASRIRDEERGLEITASEGLRVVRAASDDGPLATVGAGLVHVSSDDLAVDGDKGFELRQSGATQELRLGPEWPDEDHYYRIAHAGAEVPIQVTGSGSCRLLRSPDGGARLTLVSTRDDVVLVRGADVLDGVRSLDATVDENGTMRDLVARGARCHVLATTPGGTDQVEGHAARIASPDGRSFALTGTVDQPAELSHGPGNRVRAPEVEIVPLGRGRAWLVARGEDGRAHVRVQGVPGAEADGARLPADDLEMDADVLTLAPGLLPPILRRLHGVPRSSSVAGDHVLARGRVRMVERAPDEGGAVVRADGSTFVLSVAGARGRLTGSPATIESVLEDERRLIGRADDVRFAATPDGRGVLRLLPSDRFDPQLDVLDDRPGGGGAFDDIRLECKGTIDALPEGLRTSGPVHLVGLDEAGEVDPSAVEMRAASLDADWDQGTREVQSVVARGEPRVSFPGIAASGHLVRIDVADTTMDVFAGGDTLATVQAGGLRETGAMFRVDYAERRVQTWRPDLRAADAANPPR